MTPNLPLPTEILDLLPDAVCVVDQDGRYLFVNRVWSEIFGRSPQEVVGETAADLPSVAIARAASSACSR